MKNNIFTYSFLYSKLSNLRKIIIKIFSFFIRLNLLNFKIKIGKNNKFFGYPNVIRYPGSNIKIGNNCIFASSFKSNPLGNNKPCNIRTISKKGLFHIGNNVGISSTSIVCADQIFIGSNTLIGANSYIIDTDFHQNDHLLRKRRSSKGIRTNPVKIGDNCWIGGSYVILKGVELGSNVIMGLD